jgi:acetyltransferase-like isoleucine patch superfamily enzyme
MTASIEDGDVSPDAVVGRGEGTEPVIGDDPVIRSGTIIYDDVVVGDRLRTGHNVLIREETEIGDDVLVGTDTVVDGRSTIGSGVSLQTRVYVPSETTVGDDVFVGPDAVLTNDPYPVRQDVDLVGPTLEDHVSVGANATLLPGVTVGRRAFVAAGAVVTDDVPPKTLAVGNPAEHRPLPPELDGENRIR